MVQIDRIWEFLQRLTPVTRSCLLSELERLELCGVDVPGSTDIQAKLRAEFRKDGSTQGRAPTTSRYFFEPLDPLLAEGEHENAGRFARARWCRSGSGSAGTCCRRWRAISTRR